MACDLCGKQGPTRKTRVEGIVYDACSDCAKLGSDATPAQPPKKRASRSHSQSNELFVRQDANNVLRRAREQAGKNHEEFAKELNVKESSVHAWETGSRQPTISTAKRLEKALGVSLLESSAPVADSNEYRPRQTSSGGGMTIADLLKKK